MESVSLSVLFLQVTEISRVGSWKELKFQISPWIPLALTCHPPPSPLPPPQHLYI